MGAIGRKFPMTIAIFVASLAPVQGQTCFSWMIPEYSTYTSITTDGSKIYSSVTVDGTTGGVFLSLPLASPREDSLTHFF